MTELPLIARARRYARSVALRSATGERTYNELLERSATLAMALMGDEDDLHEARVAYLVPGGFEYFAVQWAIWRAGGVAVPLSMSATKSELEYVLADSVAHCVVAPRELAERVASLCDRLELQLVLIEDAPDATATNLPIADLPLVDHQRRAMILYTSGTTAQPKGVVSTHGNIQAQIMALVEAWSWHATDCIPLFLPMHHIHGIINVVCCALWSGATIEPLGRFDIDTVLKRVAADSYSVFMAVPTIYVKLIQALEAMPAETRAPIVAGFSRLRLMVSGSAALPASVHESWTELTGQKLLERYGMTEIGMALSNPYGGARLPGTVGQPLPGVQLRLKSEAGQLVTADGEPGEIQVRGPAVFGEYWQRPDVTTKSFDDGWFRTGDIAVCENGYYRIMGRQAVDIIKSGGYKLSALEIEATLLEHPTIRECAVVGVPDDTWGEAVAAAVVLSKGQELDLKSLRTWCRDRLSKYKIPHRLLVVELLPRNAMGKVTKPAITKFFE